MRDECERRYRHIRDFEALLADSGTTIVKCFLHISKDEQRERLQARIDDPTKHWKFDVSDLEARKQWDDYQAAYRGRARRDVDGISRRGTSFRRDSKTHRNVMVAELLLRTLQEHEARISAGQGIAKGREGRVSPILEYELT